jgi:hypothetical protein
MGERRAGSRRRATCVVPSACFRWHSPPLPTPLCPKGTTRARCRRAAARRRRRRRARSGARPRATGAPPRRRRPRRARSTTTTRSTRRRSTRRTRSEGGGTGERRGGGRGGRHVAARGGRAERSTGLARRPQTDCWPPRACPSYSCHARARPPGRRSERALLAAGAPGGTASASTAPHCTAPRRRHAWPLTRAATVPLPRRREKKRHESESD